MSGQIFINYRRGDDPGFTRALFQTLENAFGRERLFMDVEGYIKAGDDFAHVLGSQVAQSDVLLVVIGPRWTDAADEAGRRRLDNPDDFVRIEIVSALEQNKRVIPVLVNNAPMPRADELPEPLRPLARRNAVRLTHDRFKTDVQGLIDDLKSAREPTRPGAPQPQAGVPAGGTAVAVPTDSSTTVSSRSGLAGVVRAYPPVVLAFVGALAGAGAYTIADGIPLSISAVRSIQVLPNMTVGLIVALATLVWGEGGVRGAVLTGVLAAIGSAIADSLIVSLVFSDAEWNAGKLPVPKQLVWGLASGFALLGALAVTQRRSRSAVVWLVTLAVMGASGTLFSFPDVFANNFAIPGALSCAANFAAMGLAFLPQQSAKAI